MACSDNKESTTLAAALERCGGAARTGHQAALASVDACERSVEQVRQQLQRTLELMDRAPGVNPEVVSDLRRQVKRIVLDMERRFARFRRELERDARQLGQFSVTLFGRTMAGKSTLMEILTRGDGGSIGNGAQRTTRDVRSYQWKGLKVTDVPGVAAFGGAEDERLAYDMARKADLVLFLTTDLAPQAVEAEHLARVRRLGKPVIGVCNVQHGVDRARDLRRFTRSAAQRMSPAQLRPLMRQFMTMAGQHTSMVDVRFTPVHLRARYLSQRPDHRRQARQLRQLSNFDELQQRLVAEVTDRGAFLRVKKFVDDATVLLLDVTEALDAFSRENSANGRILLDKHRKLDAWAKNFASSGKDRVRGEVARVFDQLRDQIPDFVEDNLESSRLNRRWQARVKAARIQPHLEQLQRDLWQECGDELQVLRDELSAETRTAARLRDRLNPARVVDGKRIVKWATVLGSGALAVAAVILASSPLGWAAAAVGLVGGLVAWFFEDGEQQRRKQRDKLQRKLEKQLEKQRRAQQEALLRWFSRDVLRGQVGAFQADLQAQIDAHFALADAQRGLARQLSQQCVALGRRLLREALDRCAGAPARGAIRSVARVPGAAMMLELARGRRVSPELLRRLRRLLDEEILLITRCEKTASTVRQALGQACRGVSMEQRIDVVHVKVDRVTPAVMARVSLAQQLCGLQLQVDAAPVRRGARRAS